MTRRIRAWSCWVVALLAGLSILNAQDGEQEMALGDYWDVDGNQMVFHSQDLVVHAEVPRGFTSLKIRGDEFLHAGEKYGAMLFRHGDEWATPKFYQVHNQSHDSTLGRFGAVQDGLFLLKFITGWTLPDVGIYAGTNLPAEHELVMFLGDDVDAVRIGSFDGGRSGARQIVTHENAKTYQARPKQAAIVVHRSGRALLVGGPATIGPVTAPDGKQRLALVLPVKGQAANQYRLRIEPYARQENLVVFPQWDVTSSNEQKCPGIWAIWDRDTKVDAAFTFGWLGRDHFPGYAELDIRHSLGGPKHFHQRVQVLPEHRQEDGRYRVPFDVKLHRPGISEVWGRILDRDGNVIWVARFRMLYDWRNYQPEYLVPDDLQEFWAETLKEMRSHPLEPEVKRVFENEPDWEMYEVSYNAFRKQRIWAKLLVPKNRKGPLPVLIGSHPGTTGWGVNKGPDGLYGSKIKADPNFITISPLIRGYQPDDPDIPFNQPWWGPFDNKEDYAARYWYAAMVRALDYLATRPDLADMSRIVARGGSQGGALAIATAALDDRVDLCLADSPSNSMLHQIIDPSMYGSFGPTVGQVPEGQTLDDAKRTLSYFDPANFATMVTCPTAIGLTVGDLTVHAAGGLGIYHNLTQLPPEQKWFLPGINSGFHANSRDGGRKFAELQQQLAEGKRDE